MMMKHEREGPRKDTSASFNFKDEHPAPTHIISNSPNSHMIDRGHPKPKLPYD
jgi:hypothetical protein